MQGSLVVGDGCTFWNTNICHQTAQFVPALRNLRRFRRESLWCGKILTPACVVQWAPWAAPEWPQEGPKSQAGSSALALGWVRLRGRELPASRKELGASLVRCTAIWGSRVCCGPPALRRTHPAYFKEETCVNVFDGHVSAFWLFLGLVCAFACVRYCSELGAK